MNKRYLVLFCALAIAITGCSEDKEITNDVIVEANPIISQTNDFTEIDVMAQKSQDNSREDENWFNIEDTISPVINFAMSEKDIIAALGQPVSVETSQWKESNAEITTWSYDSIIIEFKRINGSSQNDIFAIIFLNNLIAGPRGLTVGDPIEKLEELFNCGAKAFEDGLIYSSGTVPQLSDSCVLPPYGIRSTMGERSFEYSYVAPDYTKSELIENDYEFMFLPHYTMTVTVEDSIVNKISIVRSVFIE